MILTTTVPFPHYSDKPSAEFFTPTSSLPFLSEQRCPLSATLLQHTRERVHLYERFRSGQIVPGELSPTPGVLHSG